MIQELGELYLTEILAAAAALGVVWPRAAPERPVAFPTFCDEAPPLDFDTVQALVAQRFARQRQRDLTAASGGAEQPATLLDEVVRAPRHYEIEWRELA